MPPPPREYPTLEEQELYRFVDAAVVRAAACSPGSVPLWPDLTDDTEEHQEASWVDWLRQMLVALASAGHQSVPVDDGHRSAALRCSCPCTRTGLPPYSPCRYQWTALLYKAEDPSRLQPVAGRHRQWCPHERHPRGVGRSTGGGAAAPLNRFTVSPLGR